MESHVVHEDSGLDLGAAMRSPIVIDAVEAAGNGADSNISETRSYVKDGKFTAETGVVLKLKKVPRMVVVEAGMRIVLPKPPKIHNPDQDRWEENPLDPDYEEELNRARYYKGVASSNVYLSLGTEIVHVPEDMHRPESDEWVTDLEELGIEIPDKSKKRSRYVCWLRYYAMSDDDFTALSRATALYSGHLTERQVAEIEESFRDQSEGNPDTGSPATSEN